ncbi:hypothetical protein JKP88DRAFT_253629, partial [Tribonema minus]
MTVNSKPMCDNAHEVMNVIADIAQQQLKRERSSVESSPTANAGTAKKQGLQRIRTTRPESIDQPERNTTRMARNSGQMNLDEAMSVMALIALPQFAALEFDFACDGNTVDILVRPKALHHLGKWTPVQIKTAEWVRECYIDFHLKSSDGGVEQRYYGHYVLCIAYIRPDTSTHIPLHVFDVPRCDVDAVKEVFFVGDVSCIKTKVFTPIAGNSDDSFKGYRAVPGSGDFDDMAEL